MAITTDRDRVRLLIGDTDSTAPLLYDDEVDAVLGQRGVLDNGGTIYNIPAAAADAAGAIAAKYARGFNFQTDGQSFNRSERVNHYQAVARDLRNRSGGYSHPVTLAGTATT